MPFLAWVIELGAACGSAPEDGTGQVADTSSSASSLWSDVDRGRHVGASVPDGGRPPTLGAARRIERWSQSGPTREGETRAPEAASGGHPRTSLDEALRDSDAADPVVGGLPSIVIY